MSIKLSKSISHKEPPHTYYPDILHWQDGDEIIARNVTAKNWFSKLSAFEIGNLNISYYYRGVTGDGTIIIEEKETGILHKESFWQFIKKAKNLSFSNRMIHSELEQSNEYMALMEEFRKAYEELQKTDEQRVLK